MNIRNGMTVMGLAFGAMVLGAQAQAQPAAGASEQATTIIDIAGHSVPVRVGGLYDRYRSNPPLAVIAQEAPEVDLSWFKTLAKQKVNVGFDTYSPNFYYKDSSITAVFTADLETLRALMPPEVRSQVQPLQVWPGRGAVALTAYAYHYCDNDAYNELSLAIVTNKPGAASFGPLSLLGQSRSKSFWGYVLKLPVNTELARVRGVVGYKLPKWLSDISYRESADALTFQISDPHTGKPDLVFRGNKLADLSSEVALVTNSFTNLDKNGQLNYGYSLTRQLRHASSTDQEAIGLTLGDGSLSTYIKSLKLGKMLKYEYVPQFQGALYAPQPLARLADRK
jgi:hypothetical protein